MSPLADLLCPYAAATACAQYTTSSYPPQASACPFSSVPPPASESQSSSLPSTSSPAKPGVAGAGCPWRHKWNRPEYQKDLKLTRRQLRQLNRSWTADEVRKHKYADDAWIAVDGKVYDITEHIATHPGWDSAGISTILSILAHVGTECTEEFTELHRPYPVAWKQLAAFYIGEFDNGDAAPEE